MPATPDRAPLIVITITDPLTMADPPLSTRKNELYAEAVGRHGGKPAFLSPSTAAGERDRLLAEMDGLMLSGGAGDIDPSLYGETPQGALPPEPDRDRLELAAWREAERRNVPVLGICRGFQIINVFSGGSLVQDLPGHAGIPYGHGEPEMHDLEIEPRSRLGRAVAAASPDGLAAGDPTDLTLDLQVNTYHHQGVTGDRVAAGLRPVAWAPSELGRLVEAVEGRGKRWLVGIQCHPERTESTPQELEGLFADFVGAARATGRS
jgi:putative glutamine amidotransferase